MVGIFIFRVVIEIYKGRISLLGVLIFYYLSCDFIDFRIYYYFKFIIMYCFGFDFKLIIYILYFNKIFR